MYNFSRKVFLDFLKETSIQTDVDSRISRYFIISKKKEFIMLCFCFVVFCCHRSLLMNKQWHMMTSLKWEL